MKRLLALILALALVLALMAGCSLLPAKAEPEPEPVNTDVITAGMPGPDGGPMLYPVIRTRGDGWQNLFCIINQKGEFVSDAFYDYFSYVYTPDGKPWYVLVGKGSDSAAVRELYALSGKLAARFQASSAYQAIVYSPVMGYTPYLYVSHRENDEQDWFNTPRSLFSLETLDMIFTSPGMTDFDVLGQNALRITRYVQDAEPNEYDYREVHTVSYHGQKIDPNKADSGELFPATSLVTNLCGYTDENGNWIIPAVYESTTWFKGDYAAVCLPNEGGWYFIDKTGAVVGKKYGFIEDVNLGWCITPDGYEDYRYTTGCKSELLSKTLETMIPLTDGYLSLAYDYNDYLRPSCYYIVSDESYQFFAVDGKPLGEFTLDMYNAAADEPISSMGGTWLNASLGDIICMGYCKTAMSLSTGKLIPLPEGSYPVAVTPGGNLAVYQYSETGISRYFVINPDGEEVHDKLYSDFTIEQYFYDQPMSREYFWVKQGRWQGYVDRDGNWRYRENRYQFLED